MWECPSFQMTLLYELGGSPDRTSPSCSDGCRQFYCSWVLRHSPVIILCWNEIVRKGIRIPPAVPWKSRSECLPSKVGWVANSERKRSARIATERQAHVWLRAFAAVFTFLPTGRQVKALLETSSPEKCLQWALDLWPDSTANKTWCNTTLHCSLTFWGWKDTELLFPSFPCPPFPYFWHLAPTFLLFCHQESEAVAKMKTKAVTLVLGLSLLACGHSHLPASLWHGNQVPLP